MKSEIDHASDDPETIRSEINTTRHRMDETIDALGQRLKGRHLLDEVLHLFRKQQENGNMIKIKNKISDSAGTAYHSVVDTVKAHPLPFALVGAGIGWLIYEQTRSKPADISEYRVARPPYDEDFSPGPLSGSTLGEGALPADVSSGGQSKTSRVMETIQQKTSEVRDRLRHTGTDAAESARRLYDQGRQRVSSAVEENPLQSGLVLLAAGVIAGMLMPTPRRLSESVAPKARQLREQVRDKAQDLAQRGSHVVESATQAAKQEAKQQGLTSSSGEKSGGKTQETSSPTSSQPREKASNEKPSVPVGLGSPS